MLQHTTSSSCGKVTAATHAMTPKKHNSNHLSVHLWIRSAIRDSQQPISPIGFLFLKLPPPPCAVRLVYIHTYIHSTFNIRYITCMHACMHAWIHAGRHTDIQTDRQADIHTEIQTYRHTIYTLGNMSFIQQIQRALGKSVPRTSQ